MKKRLKIRNISHEKPKRKKTHIHTSKPLFLLYEKYSIIHNATKI